MKIAAKPKLKWEYIVPISIFSSLAPLITRLKVIEISDETTMLLGGGNNIYNDFFSYNKMVVIILSLIIAFSIYIFRGTCKQDLKSDKFNIWISTYFLTIILSLLLSNYKNTAFIGLPGRYEGTFVLIAYIFMFFFTIYTIDDKLQVDLIIRILFLSCLIICSIGIFQYMGYDFFKTSIGKKILLPLEYRNIADELQFCFGKYAIYSTLNNTNYVGSYSALLLPIITTKLYIEEKKTNKILYGLFLLLVIVNWFGCNSRAGYLGVLTAFIVLVIGFRKEIIKNWKSTSLILLSLILTFALLNKFSDGKIKNRFIYLKEDVKKVFSGDANISKTLDIKIDENKLIFKYGEVILNVEANEQGIIFLDKENKPIQTKYNLETGALILEDERYEGFNVKILNDGIGNVLQINKGWKFNFHVSEKGFEILNKDGIPIELKDPPHIGFEGKENLGSSRGYIYSRSLPLLKDTILIGHGADTYIFYFPQDDIVGKANYMANPYIVVDKPHNMYLQMAINTGIVSLIAFLAMIVIYTIRTIKALKKSKEYGYYEFMSVAILASVWGYLVAGLFNDSVVSIAPVFWTLWGLGMAINTRMKKAIN